ncbi:hypothetical protein [Saccharothrix obliqua]|uniref:hypothetical protein n=1 Tax=Saccharothrix obliqua TaxID=2861747 RepID=UPI001C5EC92C|nr:hypothetical protein [Saccharothrix obliqua]MBW4716006.1 hypothetical protein [Saccharothrix obliqua]
MTGVPEAFDRFRADLAAAVTRGRRAAAAAGAKNAALRDRNRESARQARDRAVRPGEHVPTPDDVRRVATGFREYRGLPVDRLPDAAELLAPPGKSQEQTDANANTASAPEPSGSRPVAGPSGQLPPETGDDEDFSQARILY